MSTASTTPHTAVQQLIEQRLDAIDHALLGLLPRQDRLAAVSQVEIRIRELVAANSATAANQQAPHQGLALADSALSSGATPTLAFLPHSQPLGMASGGWISSTQKRRSRLAVSAGVLGILACVLLLMMPVTYFIVMSVGEVLGEVVSIALLGTHALALVLGGVTAVGLGIAALVSLKRRKEQLVGHGWAIAGLCAGPLPMLLGIAAVLLVGVEMGVAEFFTGSEPAVASHADSPAESERADENGPVKNLNSSEEAEELPSAPDVSRSAVHSAGHEVPAAATELPAVESGNAVPATPAGSPTPTKPEPQHQTEPQSAPQPESPAEPGSMPESPPAIGGANDSSRS